MQNALEEICDSGCQLVWQVIEQLKQGHPIPEVEKLRPEQTELLLAELESVMAVYTGTCEAPLK